MRTDGLEGGRTDMTKLMVALRNIANASKKYVNFFFCKDCNQHAFSLSSITTLRSHLTISGVNI
jgi:hypothetical protein